MMQYLTIQDKEKLRRLTNRSSAVLKIAGDSDPKCEICGCPHPDVLLFGFKKHREGRWHRNKNVILWILRSPIEMLKELIQLECPYCNIYFNRFKEYPPPEKRPRW